jgi:acyl carrier protein
MLSSGAIPEHHLRVKEILSIFFRSILSRLWFPAAIEKDALDIVSEKENKMRDKIRELLGKLGGLPVSVDTLTDGADLYAAGLSSFASVQLMLGIEDAFDIEFPDHLLNRKSFASIDAIADTVASIVEGREAA